MSDIPIIGEKDPIPFEIIKKLINEELLSEDAPLIVIDLKTKLDFKELRRIKKEDVKDSSLKAKLFCNGAEEISMSDAIRITENIVGSTSKEDTVIKKEADELLKKLFEERMVHNEEIIAQVRKSALDDSKDKLHAMLWDDEGHTSVVLYCDPKYYFFDSCGCKQFGRHPMTPTDNDHLLVSRMQYDGYNCRTMSYIMIENALQKFKSVGKDGFNTYFTSQNYFGAYDSGIRPYIMRLANGSTISIRCERDPKDVVEGELNDPISIPSEIRVIAQRSAIFNAYADVLKKRLKDLEDNIKNTESKIKKIKQAEESVPKLEQALKQFLISKLENNEGETLFDKLKKQNFDYSNINIGSHFGNSEEKSIRSLCGRLKAGIILKQKVSDLKRLNQELINEQTKVEELKEKLQQIEQERRKTIVGVKKMEDSLAVVEKRKENLDKLEKTSSVIYDVGQTAPTHTSKLSQKNAGSNNLGIE